jgi:hypothetical protein
MFPGCVRATATTYQDLRGRATGDSNPYYRRERATLSPQTICTVVNRSISSGSSQCLDQRIRKTPSNGCVSVSGVQQVAVFADWMTRSVELRALSVHFAQSLVHPDDGGQLQPNSRTLDPGTMSTNAREKVTCYFSNLPRGARCNWHHEAQPSMTDSRKPPRSSASRHANGRASITSPWVAQWRTHGSPRYLHTTSRKSDERTNV